MARAPLVAVPDEGAAWLVRDALADGGVTAEVERAGPEHPYMTSVLAHPMRIFVPAEQLEQARLLLAGLEAELASHPEELAAQALAAGQPGSDSGQAIRLNREAPEDGRGQGLAAFADRFIRRARRQLRGGAGSLVPASRGPQAPGSD